MALLGVLLVYALTGFSTVYAGSDYLVVGGIGTLAGLSIALVTAKSGRGLGWAALATVLAFVLLGGPVAARSQTIAGFIPTTASLAALFDGLIRGWVNLLTALPPVGDTANLLVIPFVCGLVAAVAAASMSLRMRGKLATLALSWPLAIVVITLVMGTSQPAWSLAQNAVFGGLCVMWGAMRQNTGRTSAIPLGRSIRWMGAFLTLAAAGAIAVLAADLPLITGENARVVKREDVEPPLDLRQYPSPLAGFRRFLDDDQERAVLFTVSGLPDGGRVRLATLDRYDGVVWQVAGGHADDASSGFFQRVGAEVAAPEAGERANVTIEIRDYRDIWVPGAGQPAQLAFGGPRSDALATEYRHNLATGGAVVPSGLEPGDRIETVAVLPLQHAPADIDALASAPVEQPDPLDVPDAVTDRAVDFSGTGSTAGSRANAMAKALQSEGLLSHGKPSEEKSPAGHSSARIEKLLVQPEAMIGDEEQFAAALALMARDRGIPSRVVMGFKPKGGGGGTVDIHGSDVTAWVEVNLSGAGWVPLDPTPMKTTRPKAPKPKPLPNLLTPPPSMTVPPKVFPRSDADAGNKDDPAGVGFRIPMVVFAVLSIPAIPVLVIGGITAFMMWLKRRRRQKRRTRGAPSTRIASGFEEVVDLARDMGDVVPDRTTRREAAVLLARPGTDTLAATADAWVFGGDPLADVDAEAYWSDVEMTRAALLGGLTRTQRWKANVNPSSLRRRRRGSPL